MYEALIHQIEEALARTAAWAETGWPVTFGFRNVAVTSLKEALALPKNAVFRQEAINYWRQVELTAEDTSAYGRKAIDALRQCNIESAVNDLYFAQYMEKPFAEYARTWLPLYEALHADAGSCC